MSRKSDNRQRGVSATKLSESEQQRLRAEEIYRSEVQKSLDSRSKLTQFLETHYPLIHTLIAACVVALVTWVVQTHKDDELKDTRIRQLCDEITGRIMLYTTDSPGDVKNQITTLNGLGGTFFPQYDARRFQSLLWELRNSVDAKDNKSKLDGFVDGFLVLERPTVPSGETPEQQTNREGKRESGLKELMNSVKELTDSIRERHK